MLSVLTPNLAALHCPTNPQFYHPGREYNVRVASRYFKGPELLVDLQARLLLFCDSIYMCA